MRDHVTLETDDELRTNVDYLNSRAASIATGDPVLCTKLLGVPERLVNHLMPVAEDGRVLMAKLGPSSPGGRHRPRKRFCARSNSWYHRSNFNARFFKSSPALVKTASVSANCCANATVPLAPCSLSRLDSSRPGPPTGLQLWGSVFLLLSYVCYFPS